MYPLTAIERIKTLGGSGSPLFGNLFLDDTTHALREEDLLEFFYSKGFTAGAVRQLAKQDLFNDVFTSFMLRSQTLEGSGKLINESLARLSGLLHGSKKFDPYIASHQQNANIAAAVANGGVSDSTFKFGDGSATNFDNTLAGDLPKSILSVPIAIIGYGCAGILVAAALYQLGFTEVKVFEKKAEGLGIWALPNVAGLSRNNPLKLTFLGNQLDAAPGSGEEVQNFLYGVMSFSPSIREVIKIKPGKLFHTLTFKDGGTRKFPIVIVATGIGKPKHVNDPLRMQTDTGERHAGLRWQFELEAAKVSGKQIVLNGLGNSTAEMLKQIHDLQDAGVRIDYRVITHYPENAVNAPTRYVQDAGRTWRVFRDLSLPNLVDYQGDLSSSRYDYFRALHTGRIVAGVKRWEVEQEGLMKLFGKDNLSLQTVPYDKVMTLIGYRQSVEQMTALGCAYDTENRCGHFDYDGEFIARPGERNPHKRLWKGCYGFGSVTESPSQPNAIVIPGMLHQLYDLMFGVIMRATEVKTSKTKV